MCLSEKAILMEIDHPFIVNCEASFQDPAYLYLSLEFVVGGEFFTHLRKAGRLDNNASKFYSAQITAIFEIFPERIVVLILLFVLFILGIFFDGFNNRFKLVHVWYHTIIQ